MDNVNFCYATWYRARRQMIEALDLNPKQVSMFSSWLQKHLFEIGASSNTDQNLLEAGKDSDFEKYIIKKLAKEIAYKIYELKLFDLSVTQNNYQVQHTMRCLIVGTPALTTKGTFDI